MDSSFRLSPTQQKFGLGESRFNQHKYQANEESKQQISQHVPGVITFPMNITKLSKEQLEDFKSKLPKCHCGSGSTILYICMPEAKKPCPTYVSLKDEYSFKRYFCDECMETEHDHRPIKIYNKTCEIAQQWRLLHEELVGISNNFQHKMKGLGQLLSHFDAIAISHNLDDENSVTTKLRNLDQVKGEFEEELNGQKDLSINYLIRNFKVLELLIREPLRLNYALRIANCKELEGIDQEQLSGVYKEAIEISGAQPWDDLYNNPDNQEINRDLYLRLKIASLTQLRQQDAKKIEKLEKQVELLVKRMAEIDKKNGSFVNIRIEEDQEEDY